MISVKWQIRQFKYAKYYENLPTMKHSLSNLFAIVLCDIFLHRHPINIALAAPITEMDPTEDGIAPQHGNVSFEAATSGCGPGTFGINCQQKCHCRSLDPKECNPTTGLCGSNQCAVGYTDPPTCQTACSPGTFGFNCGKDCHCPPGILCDHVIGSCVGNHCGEGYVGPGCQYTLPSIQTAPYVIEKSLTWIVIGWRAWTPNHEQGSVDKYLVQALDPVTNDIIDVKTIDVTDKNSYANYNNMRVLRRGVGPFSTISPMKPLKDSNEFAKNALEAQGSLMSFPESVYKAGKSNSKNQISRQRPPNAQQEQLNRNQRVSVAQWYPRGKSNRHERDLDSPLGTNGAIEQVKRLLKQVKKHITVDTPPTRIRKQVASNEMRMRIDNIPNALSSKFRILTLIRHGDHYDKGQPGPWSPVFVASCDAPTAIPEGIDVRTRRVDGDVATISITWNTLPHHLSGCDRLQYLTISIEKCHTKTCRQYRHLQQVQGDLDRTFLDVDGVPISTPLRLSYFYVNNAGFKGPSSNPYIINDVAMLGKVPPGTDDYGSSGYVMHPFAVFVLTIFLIILVTCIVGVMHMFSVKNAQDDFKRKVSSRAMSSPHRNTVSSSLAYPLEYKGGWHEDYAVDYKQNYTPASTAYRYVKSKGYTLEEIRALMANDKLSTSQLREEYDALPTGYLRGTHIALMDKNKDFNRTSMVLPYDDKRVVLGDSGDNTKNYINASHVDIGVTVPLIITQAPMENTAQAFWQMVWENKVSRIVMLMDEYEPMRIEAVKYWKGGQRKKYGQIYVKVLSLRRFAHYDVREMKLTHARSDASRTLTHLKFDGWATNGTPAHMVPFVIFMEKALAISLKGGCAVVQCPNGAGRSGMYVCMESEILAHHYSGKIHIFDTAKKIRKERVKVISTFSQYKFVYDYFADIFLTRYAVQKQDFLLIVKDEHTLLAELQDFQKQQKRMEGSGSRGIQNDSDDVLMKAKGRTYEGGVIIASSYKQPEFFIVAPFPANLEERVILLTSAWKTRASVMIQFSERVLFPGASNQTLDFFNLISRGLRGETNSIFLEESIDYEIRNTNGPLSDVLQIKNFVEADWTWRYPPPPKSYIEQFLSIARWRNNNQKFEKIILVSDERESCCLFMSIWNILERLDEDRVVDIYSMSLYTYTQFEGVTFTLEQYKFLHRLMKEYFELNKSRGMTPNSTQSSLRKSLQRMEKSTDSNSHSRYGGYN